MKLSEIYLYRKLSEYKSRWKYLRKVAPIKKALGKVDKFSKKTNILENSVIIIEPNPFHAETLPGYIKYFLDLGFNVDVFITYENAYEKPFCRMTEKFRPFIGDYKDIQNWITYRNISKYKIIFFSTLFYNVEHKFLPSIVPDKSNLFGIVHNIELYKKWLICNPSSSDFYWMLNNNHFASLSKIKDFYYINPNYFGNINEERKITNKIVFVTVGAINANYKNHSLLIDTVYKLINNGIKNFEVNIIGSGSIDIPDDLQDYIKLCGRLDFPSLYTKMEEASFILALLDPFNKSHQAYLHGTTSGSLQLSLGFTKPLIINSLFAKAYSIDSKSAIIYSDNALFEAMREAIEIPSNQYLSIQESIAIKREKIRDESLEEIKLMIKDF